MNTCATFGFGRPLSILLIASTLALGACGDDDQRSTDRTIGDTNTMRDSDNTQLSAKAFVERATWSGMFEVESSQLALSKQVPERVRTLAQTMVDDHKKANEKLARIAGELNIDVPGTMDQAHQQKLQQLQQLEGEQFTTRYVDMQHQGHVDAIDLFTRAQTEVREQKLADFARETLPTLKKHMEMVRERQSGTGNENTNDRTGTGNREQGR